MQEQQRRSGTGVPVGLAGPGDWRTADRISEGAMQLLYVAWQDLAEDARSAPGGDLDRALACVHDAIGDLREIADELRHPRASRSPQQVPPVRRGLRPAEVLTGPRRAARIPYIARQTA